jgi:hypothetical protein
MMNWPARLWTWIETIGGSRCPLEPAAQPAVPTTIRRKMLFDRVSQVVSLKRFVQNRKSAQRWRIVARHEYQGGTLYRKGFG